MHKNLTATVHMGTTRLTAIKDAMVARTGSVSTVVLEPVIHERVFDPVTKIVGPAQEVMQLIGELASQGEDCLQSCTRTRAA